MAAGIYKTTIRSLPFVYRGKVRDSYAVGEDKLLIVTTDRLSAFDVVMSQPIPTRAACSTRCRTSGSSGSRT
jgi:phosphoribosylaminoimidazole-succinocarboxamide synthase